MAEFEIAGRRIGDDHPPIVIAEIGINHEGSLDLAIAMADAAIGAGAEIIKHQTHIIEDEMSDEAKAIVPGNADVSIYEIMQRCTLSEDAERSLMNYVTQRGGDIYQYAIFPGCGRTVGPVRHTCVQNRFRRVQQLSLGKMHRVIGQAGHSEHWYEFDRYRSTFRRNPAQCGSALCIAALYQHLPYPPPPPSSFV